MDGIPDLKTVLQAINALYHDPDNSGKERASQWLGSLQNSVYAWKISDQLLIEKHNMESCYFAAQTMRTKIQHNFEELPEEAYQSLRDSLINHILNLGENDNPIIITQLCLALADLALLMTSWKDISKDLINRFANDPKYLPTLFEILTVFPEETKNRYLRLGDIRRQEIAQDFPYVYNFLNVYCNTVTICERNLHKIFKCAHGWFGLEKIQSSLIDQSKIFVILFETLINVNSQSFVHEAATDVVCTILLIIEDIDNNLSLAKSLIKGVFSLVDSYHQSVTQEEHDKSVNYCRIFTELAESLLDQILRTPGKDFGNLETLDLLLICVGNPDYELAEITFNFWYRLSEELYAGNDDRLNAIFRPYIERLITSLCKHCCLEPDMEGIPDDNDSFSVFRNKVSELIKDVVFIIGSKNCIQQMFHNLKNQAVNSSWEHTEAALFVMSSIAKNVLPQEDEVVSHIMEALLHLPESNVHVAVRYTGTYLVGELCEWIDSHPSYLERILSYLLIYLQDPMLGSVAASALQKVCSSCRDHMDKNFSGLLQVTHMLDSLSISHAASIDLLRGTCKILARMPLNDIEIVMKDLCAIQLSQLMKVIQEDESMQKKDPVVWLDRLAAIFSYTTPMVPEDSVHPARSIVEDVWPVLTKICEKYKADLRITERFCRCIRFIIRCLGKQSAVLLQPLVQQIVELYQVYHHSCFLYLGGILVDEFGSDMGCIQGLIDMLTAFSTPTFMLLEGENGLRNHPDTVDDLFRLCIRFIQRSPVIFLQCSIINHVINCALAACTLEHKDANATVMNFFRALAKCSRVKEDDDDITIRRSLVSNLLKEHGQTLINNLIYTPINSFSSFVASNISEVILELMLTDRPSVCLWLEIALKNLPKHKKSGIVTATNEQLVKFHDNVTKSYSSKEIRCAIREFSLLFG